MKPLALFAVVGLLLSNSYAQQASQESPDEVLRKGLIVAKNIHTAINIHLTEESNFRPSKQMPEDPRPEAPMLVKKDNTIVFDWTPGQQARYLMEEIRQGLHAIESSNQPRGLDAVALAGGREYWPKLRDISCKDAPGTRYYDLDGLAQFCPAK